MAEKFEEGELYRHDNALDTDIQVMAIHSEDAETITMAVFFVTQKSRRVVAPDVITVKKADLGRWTKVEA